MMTGRTSLLSAILLSVSTLLPLRLSAAIENYPIRVMPLGDSITQMNAYYDSYRRPLWHKLDDVGYDIDFVGSTYFNYYYVLPPHPDFDLDHEGHWGYRADQDYWVLYDTVNDTVPDVVLMHLGTNDCIQNYSAESTIADLSGCIDLLRAANPNVTVFVSALIPSSDSYINNRINALNSQIPGFVTSKNTAQSRVILVNVSPTMNTATDYFDDVHPNDAGAEKMAVQWYNAMRKYFAAAEGSSDPGIVLAHLDDTQWEQADQATLPFGPPVYTVAGGLGIAVKDPNNTFGYWQTKEALTAPPAGHYRLHAHVEVVRTAERDAELRMRVFRADNRASRMEVIAEITPGTGVPTDIAIEWDSDGTTPWRVAFDLLAFQSNVGGEYTITAVDNTLVQ